MVEALVRAVGRRKEAVAQVRFYHGTGTVTLNGRPLERYFPTVARRMRVLEPLRVANAEGRYDIVAQLHGGGVSGQADAMRLGIARGLIALDPDLRTDLKRAGLLTRDARVVERKKYGLRKARRAPQYTKR
jgi:small subunit ribosomal protein S9